MSRFVLGNCIDVMARIPDNAIDFILTDPPYLVGFRDRQGRTIAGDKTDEWLQPACNGVVCGRGRNPTLRLWPAIFSGEIDVFPSERRNMGQEIGR
ncbi:hypothetical protein APT25_17460 [Escherichia coli]|nr:hypothetical protein APT25_17460 [Escherichia coli]HAH2766129.1 hypothetical protein [Escherichia coli]HAH2768091.1 hypothetical protein [Escherichia coli]HAH2768103.1 hypothetical protein [Escherichia coli]